MKEEFFKNNQEDPKEDIKQKKGNKKSSPDNKSGKKKETDIDEMLGKIDEYQKKTEKLESSLEETNEKFLRLFSEFDNYRKRAGRERIELTKTAAEGVISALLPVLDDLERASEMSVKGDEGVELIYNKFKGILRQKGLEEIPADGEEFNTDYHEAITHVPAGDKGQKGKVVEQVQKGYMLNGKVIRYARVVVAN